MTDILGRTFHRWTVLKASKPRFFLCRCDCGSEREVRKDQLTRGVSKSCGCWKAEVSKARIIRLSTTHGLSKKKTRAYGIWKGMRKRCNNKNDRSYENYGGRGIKVCRRWDSFPAFLNDMGEPSSTDSLDRIDNNGDYKPSNCRWATKKTQMNNMRTSLLYRMDGETLTLKQWAERKGLPYHRVYQRVFKLSWPIKKALLY